MRAFVLSSSPRRNGNSAALARAAADGLAEAGHQADLVYADEILAAFLKDCRQCRKSDGECSIEDRFRSAFVDGYLPAEGFVAATPIYWYGMSSQLKAFFDRMFCYIAASYPRSPAIVERMRGKRIGLLLSSEETFPTVSAAIVQQVQEYSRYTRSSFVGVVHGYGNARGDIAKDPNDPIAHAYAFGRDFFTRHATDYQIDTPRSARVWG
jgi:multimeric flavodoxin WrbA